MLIARGDADRAACLAYEPANLPVLLASDLLARPALQLCLHVVEVGALEKVDNLLLAVDVELLEHVVAVRVDRAGEREQTAAGERADAASK